MDIVFAILFVIRYSSTGKEVTTVQCYDGMALQQHHFRGLFHLRSKGNIQYWIFIQVELFTGWASRKKLNNDLSQISLERWCHSILKSFVWVWGHYWFFHKWLTLAERKLERSLHRVLIVICWQEVESIVRCFTGWVSFLQILKWLGDFCFPYPQT